MGGVIISEPEEGSPIEDLPWVIVFQSPCQSATERPRGKLEDASLGQFTACP